MIPRAGAEHEEIRDEAPDYMIPRAGAEHGETRDLVLHDASPPKGGLHIAVLMALALDVFFAVAPGHAILDIGAAQDLIGEPAFQKLSGRLRKQGLRCLRLPTEPPAAHGVGGQATPLFQALVPCVLASVPGVVRVTVIKEDVPHLLSVGLLEATGAVIDMQRNTVNYKGLGVSEAMIRMRSGHRVVDIASWEGTTYPVPPHLCKEYGLTEGAFNTGKTLTGTAVEVYMACAGIGLGSESHDGGALKPGGAILGSGSAAVKSCLHVVPKMPETPEHPPEHVIDPCVLKPFSRGGCEPLHAERLASHGEQPRAQLEAPRDSPAEPTGGDAGAGREPDMPAPSRVRSQWCKSIWLLAALSALPDQDQLCAAPCQAPRQGWQEGGGLHEPAAGSDLGTARGCCGQQGAEHRDRGDPGQGDGREHPPASSGNGAVQPAGADRHGSEQPAGDDRHGHHDPDDAGYAGHATGHDAGGARLDGGGNGRSRGKRPASGCCHEALVSGRSGAARGGTEPSMGGRPAGGDCRLEGRERKWPQ